MNVEVSIGEGVPLSLSCVRRLNPHSARVREFSCPRLFPGFLCTEITRLFSYIRRAFTDQYFSSYRYFYQLFKHLTDQTLLKKGLLLTAIQIRGTAETRRCDADAVRLQVITWNPPLTLCASYLPLPPPSSAPCSQSRLLSLPSLIQHMVYRGVPK